MRVLHADEGELVDIGRRGCSGDSGRTHPSPLSSWPYPWAIVTSTPARSLCSSFATNSVLTTASFTQGAMISRRCLAVESASAQQIGVLEDAHASYERRDTAAGWDLASVIRVFSGLGWGVGPPLTLQFFVKYWPRFRLAER